MTGSADRGGGVGPGALALLLSGTLSSLLSKALYQIESRGRGGVEHLFTKPLASTLFMFLGMLLCLPAAAMAQRVQSWVRRLDAAAEGSSLHLQQPLLGLQRVSAGSDASSVAGGTAAALAALPAPSSEPSRRTRLLVLVPTLFDLAATVLLSVGLLFLSASVWLMLRGSEIVFSALLSVLWLRRSLNAWHWGGIAGCVAGISAVGLASVLEAEGNPQPGGGASWAAPLGMLLVLLAEAVQAAQVCTEDLLMSRLSLQPLTVVGYEGLYGTALMLGLLLPVAQVLPGAEGGGLHEDSVDSWIMLAHSHPLRLAAAATVACMAVYNVAGMLVTDELGAVTRTVLETMRTLFVWLASLLLYYASPAGGLRLGEPWTAHSWLQAVGFGIQVLGTLCYGHGEELASRRLRARLRWARLRATLAAVVSLREAARPLVRPRIAGPARARTGFVQRAGVAPALKLLAQAAPPAPPEPPSGQASTAHASVLAAAAAAVEADLEGADNAADDGTLAVAAWVAASPRAARPAADHSFHFHRPPEPPISRSAPS